MINTDNNIVLPPSIPSSLSSTSLSSTNILESNEENDENFNNSNGQANGQANKKTFTKKVTSLEIYLSVIYKNCENTMSPLCKNAKKIDENFCIPNFCDYELLSKIKYNNNNLKKIAKKYKIKISGNKNELIIRVYNYLRLSYYITKIQKIYRGFLQRKYNNFHGPAYLKRELCTNTTDFMTMDDIKTIPFCQFFSYQDVDNFIYGFDIISLYNMILKSQNVVKNPYNRNELPSSVCQNLKSILRIGKILNIETETIIKDISCDITPQKSTELRILELFQNIDSLGNYSDPSWFTSLDRFKLIRFLREMGEIWNYRAQLSVQVKRSICPPYGDPFRNVSLHSIRNEQNIDNIKKIILSIMEKFVNSASDRDNQALGAYYVLGALTLVNENAALSLPWLYQSLSYS